MASKVQRVHNWWCSFNSRVVDQHLDPPDQRVFGPPGSGSISKVWIQLLIRIWILLTRSKNSKKTLDFYCFVTSFTEFA